MDKFKAIHTNIDGLIVIEPTVFGDNRGFFMESYNKNDFAEIGLNIDFVQDNHSRSKKGILRGLHYQIKPYEMGKLVRVAKGKAFDVGVDIRPGSLSYGKWFGAILSEENHKMMYLPPGIAHGFLTLEDNTDFLYKCTGFYNPDAERGVMWNDPSVDIIWPLDESGPPILAERDRNFPTI